MATHKTHFEKQTFYFVTFTCFKWLHLIAMTNLYDYMKTWVEQIYEKGIKICGYVFMPNHIHLLVFVEEKSKGLNLVMGEAKRFLAYEIVKRLKRNKQKNILSILQKGVQPQERKKGKLHQVFRLSFDAKEMLNETEINNVIRLYAS